MADKDTKNKFAGMPPDRIEQRLGTRTNTLTKDKANENRAKATSKAPAAPANPYPRYQQRLGGLITSTSGSLQGDLDRINTNYDKLRSQIMGMYGNTTNQSLLNARDIALKELDRQADDATRQVAANYQAAQQSQLGFAEAQRQLAERSAGLQASLANVAAGNVGTWNEQLGLIDAPSVQTAQELAAAAPREAALAQALGLSSALFETDMGTSLGSQQAAIQGQIARDLAARSGQVTTQTARDIAAADIAALNEQRGILTNLGMSQMQAEQDIRNRTADRVFNLELAKIDAGLQAGLFDVETARYLAGQAANTAALAAAKEQQAFDNAITLAELELKQNQAAPQTRARVLPVTVKPITDFIKGQPALKDIGSGLSRESDAAALEDIAYVVGTQGMNLTNEDFVAIRSLWSSISPETKATLSKLPDPVNSLEDWVTRYVVGGSGMSSPRR